MNSEFHVEENGKLKEITMEETIFEELRELNRQLASLKKDIVKVDKKISKVERRTDRPWKRVKCWLKAKSKKNTFFGRTIKRLIHDYSVTWKYLYCLSQRRKGVQNNKIVFISHRGKQYSCNPMYLSEYLMEKYPGEFEIVWAFNKPNDFKYLEERGVRVVKKESKEHLHHLMTAKVIVTNVDFFAFLPKVKGQIALDTWHGGGAYKTCGFANVQNLRTNHQKRHLKRLYSKVNLYCSSSAMFTQQTIRESRLFDGEVMEVGMPRNDILVNRNRADIDAKVREYFSLDEDVKIVLYAPTYRSVAEAADFQNLDTEKLLTSLEDRFGGKWCCLYRAHHLAKKASVSADGVENDSVLSAVGYPDMQELLYAADVLISDYSSCIWDFSLQYKPVFLYCPDLEKYTDTRNFYIPIENWHFMLTKSQEELEQYISNFDQEEYRCGIQAHHRELRNCESGEATKTICKRIYDACFENQK